MVDVFRRLEEIETLTTLENHADFRVVVVLMFLQVVVRSIGANAETLSTGKSFACYQWAIDNADDSGCHGNAQRATVRGHEPAGNNKHTH